VYPDKKNLSYKEKSLDLVPILKKNVTKNIFDSMDNFDMSVVKCGASFSKNDITNEKRLKLCASPISLYTLASKHVIVRLNLENIDYASLCNVVPDSQTKFFDIVKNTLTKLSMIFKQFEYKIAHLQTETLLNCFEKDSNNEKIARRVEPRSEDEASRSCRNGFHTMLHAFSNNFKSTSVNGTYNLCHPYRNVQLIEL